ncbi:MAG: hypothetical protein KDA69_00365 [Planctomycetaceae bacterium]|nr:hypothetical protein [Planctomycetaceae bacterium]MCA9042737.1 hypothetical protein [Planctomycetaceae bacterium]
MSVFTAGLLSCIILGELAEAQSPPLKISRETTFITEPIGSNGMPDYLGAVRQRMSAGATHENNFWVLVWPAMGNAEHSFPEFIADVERQLGVTIPEQGEYRELKYSEAISKQYGKALEGPWAREECPVVANWIDDNEQFLATLKRASFRSHAYAAPVTMNDQQMLIYVLLPHVQRSRDFARLLNMRANLRMQEGDFEGAWDDLLTSYRVAGHIDKGFTLIERLVAIAIRNMTQETVCTWLSRTPDNAAKLAARRQELVPLLEFDDMSAVVDMGERMMNLQLALMIVDGARQQEEINAIFDSCGLTLDAGGGSSDAEEFQLIQELQAARGPLMRYLIAGGDINVTLKHINAHFDAMSDAMKKPTHQERVLAFEKFDARTSEDAQLSQNGLQLIGEFVFASDEDYETLPARALLGALSPAISNVNEAATRAMARRATLLAAFDVAEEIKRTGEIPTSLSSEAQLDPYTDLPLHYEVQGGAVVIYSVGQNLTDNGGRTFGEGDGMDDVRATLLIP